MKTTLKTKIVCIVMAVLLFGLSAVAVARPKDTYSDTERRLLSQMPDLSVKTLLNGTFMTEFEEYTLDQFPLREAFRTLKALVVKYVFNNSQNNDIYISDGYYAAEQYPLNTKSIDHVAKVFNSVCDRYFSQDEYNLYLSVIPDKNYFLQKQAKQLALDYDTLVSSLLTQVSQFSYIDIFDTLNVTNFYKTDTHWRQETLTDCADTLLCAMDAQNGLQYTEKALSVPFYGVYYGQAALPAEPEQIRYLDNDLFNNVTVYDHENRKEIPVYDLAKADGKDPYEFFLSGPLSLITIENPNADTDRELFLFRDSFGSSIAPLFIGSYAKITLIDIRYLQSAMLGNFVEFTPGSDVLFLYSAMILNDGTTLK